MVTARAAALTGGVGSITHGARGAASYIPESQVPDIKMIFWGLNIIGILALAFAQDGALQVQGVWFAHPYKTPDGDTQITGIRAVNPAWQIAKGRWTPDDHRTSASWAQAWRGATAGNRAASITVLGAPFQIAGIISTGDEADDRVFLPLGACRN